MCNRLFLFHSLTSWGSKDNALPIVSCQGMDADRVVDRRLPATVLSHLESFFGCDHVTVRVYEGDLHTPIPCRAITWMDSIKKGNLHA